MHFVVGCLLDIICHPHAVHAVAVAAYEDARAGDFAFGTRPKCHAASYFLVDVCISMQAEFASDQLCEVANLFASGRSPQTQCLCCAVCIS